MTQRYEEFDHEINGTTFSVFWAASDERLMYFTTSASRALPLDCLPGSLRDELKAEAEAHRI